jgi:uncharacterized membrane protein YbhN (UPF0104 family)
MFNLGLYWGLFKAVGVTVDPVVIVLSVSLSWLVAAVPVSFNGFGVREGSMVYLFALFGIPAAKAGAVGALGLLPLLLYSAAGAVLLVPELRGGKLTAFRKMLDEEKEF